LQALWRSRGQQFEAGGDEERLAAALQPLLQAATRQALERLYPGAWTEAAAAVP